MVIVGYGYVGFNDSELHMLKMRGSYSYSRG